MAYTRKRAPMRKPAKRKPAYAKRKAPARRKSVSARAQTIRIVIEQPGQNSAARPDLPTFQAPKKSQF